MTIVIFLLILSILVLVHEFGHFFVAKRFGIKVEEFGFGLPPRAFGIKKGETIYSVNWLPIGGFVKLYGEDEAGSGKPQLKVKSEKSKVDLSRAFFARPVWQRATIVVAGVVMNFLLAVFILSYLFSFEGVPIPGNEVVLTNINQNSPAQAAGLKENDVVVSFNGERLESGRELVDLARENLGEEVSLVIRRAGEESTIKLTPRENYPEDEGPIGIGISQSVEVKKYPWYQAPFLGTVEAVKLSWMIVSGIGMAVWNLVAAGDVPKDIAGPVGIAQLTGQFVQVGPYAVLSLVALLSLNLAILNILPVPALDGGRLFFILIEGITGKKLSPRAESLVHAIGMAFLLGLIALITFNDILRLFSGQPLIPVR